MDPKSIEYLNKKRKFGETDEIVPAKDIKLIRKECKKQAYHFIPLTLLLSVYLTKCFKELIGIAFNVESIDYAILMCNLLLTIIFGVGLIYRVLEYKRCESCRCDLENLLIHDITDQ